MHLSSPQHFTSMKQALISLFGDGVKVAQSHRISGGDINEAYALTLTNGTQIFLKSNTKEHAAFFTAEASGLNAIAKTGCIKTPHILCSGTEDGNPGFSFLLLEFIHSQNRAADYWESFARQLAAMHQAPSTDFVSQGTYGFLQDNYIGSTKQRNTPKDSWIEFFGECRLKPQFMAASRYFDHTDLYKINRLLDNLHLFLVEPEYPSLLHGDLWSGNFMTGNDGKAWLIDPAVYVGHAEADIAMTELFGGFPPDF